MAKAWPIEWRAYWRTRPVQPDTVLYEAYSGSGVLCNPEAIFRALLADPEKQHLNHVWAVSHPRAHREALRELAAHPRVRFVRHGSLAYHRVLATAGYLINNATFPAEFAKRPGQVYVNTWHGTPLKRMGYDALDRVGTRNIIRNLASADFVLSGSRFMTEQLYESAFRLHNVFEGQVIEEGTPRTDLQEPADVVAPSVRRELRDAGLDLAEGEQVVLYAPTWHGESFLRPEDDVAGLRRRVQEIQAGLPPGHRVLLKVHQQVHRHAAGLAGFRDVLVPNDIPTNRVLACTDVLVTDYSSIFFDFLSTGRPIVFHTPDLDDYTEGRGLYLPLEEWPGPVTRSTRELTEAIRLLGSGEGNDPQVTHASAYHKAAERFAPRDDGRVSERVVDVVFGGGAARHHVTRIRHDSRPKILMYLGGLRPNGITASAVNLLRLLDPEQVDVSVFYSHQPTAEQRQTAELLPMSVRLFPSVGSMTSSKRDRRHRVSLLRRGIQAPGLDLSVAQRMFQEEWRRCFGEIRFDHIIDFSGYAPVWAYLSLQGPARSHSIWLHSDMRSDQAREVEGARPHAENLGAVTSLYGSFDHLVSVSELLNEVNRRNLSGMAAPEKFTWVPNVIDADRIRRLASEAVEDRPGLAGAQDRTFVSVGRLSPEKNHVRLIRAFQQVHKDHPEARLLIVGDGPLRAQLAALVDELGLSSSVAFTGRVDNPYAMMHTACALIVSSDYEGHSVVTLEARVLDLPVVSTDYPSVRGVLPEGVGVVVPPSADGVAEGMRRALEGTVPHPSFDADQHNSDALDRFRTVICGVTEARKHD